MATIRTNDHAPDEEAKYILPLETFDLGPGDSFETENRNTISNAEAHPWLEVEYPEFPELGGVGREAGSVAPEDDVLSEENSLAFDREQIAKDNAEAQVTAPVAIEAGLDQGESIDQRGVAVTIAAANEAVAEAEAEIEAANETDEPKKGSSRKGA